ncbi:hypothetical protein SAMD00019534_088350 [Acytostelium subglobosum LB1]|uniref:hypothetical protein n=1 Tax=Acytostelium subglobosum LB1 TaxID=1410327 RepID=UPI000644839E|nr:hypothetical protein SAMD00019534_088350 [Acytostelium subglobosum LB1]GAM25660.1 hypothetical protein SAMD00019534_088350 [Acytostelium subglobosum LB1]|eukprot:XP_012751178.1 hypothetical protein SAMD00019534_088350 [Acytostelium subglobosum LB1]
MKKDCTTTSLRMICATDSLDKDEWVNSLRKLIQSRPNNNNNNINSNGTNQQTNVDINSSNNSISRLRTDDDTSSDHSSVSGSLRMTDFGGYTNTICLTPTMLALKDKFGLNTFTLELNKKRDLLSLEEVEMIIKLLEAHMKSEIEDSTKEYDGEIVEIIKQIYKLRDVELDKVEEDYRRQKYDLMAEIASRNK